MFVWQAEGMFVWQAGGMFVYDRLRECLCVAGCRNVCVAG